jgi:hypothetical protein
VALALQTTTLPAGEVEQAYDANLTAIGGSGSYSWSVVGGALPAGLTLDAVTGAISGTPTADGTSSFTVQVQDGALSTATQALSITVDPVPPAQATLRISADNGEDAPYSAAPAPGHRAASTRSRSRPDRTCWRSRASTPAPAPGP